MYTGDIIHGAGAQLAIPPPGARARALAHVFISFFSPSWVYRSRRPLARPDNRATIFVCAIRNQVVQEHPFRAMKPFLFVIPIPSTSTALRSYFLYQSCK